MGSEPPLPWAANGPRPEGNPLGEHAGARTGEDLRADYSLSSTTGPETDPAHKASMVPRASTTASAAANAHAL